MAFLDDVGLAVRLALSCNRYLRDAYTGPIIRLRDTDDSSEADFYPDGSGGLAQGSTSGDPPATWGVGPFQVCAVYDQSGSGIIFDVEVSVTTYDNVINQSGRHGFMQGRLRSDGNIQGDDWDQDESLWTVIGTNNQTDTTAVVSSGFLGHSALSLAGIHIAPTDDGDPGAVDPIGFRYLSDQDDQIIGDDRFAQGEAFCAQMLIYDNDSDTQADVKGYAEDVEDGAGMTDAEIDIRDFLFEIGRGGGTEDQIVWHEGFIVTDATDISDEDRSAIAQNCMAYYETRDYVPAAAGSILPAMLAHNHFNGGLAA